MARLHRLFGQARELGSLIDPGAVGDDLLGQSMNPFGSRSMPRSGGKGEPQAAMNGPWRRRAWRARQRS